MINGRSQEVPIDSFPAGAQVEVMCGDAPKDGGTTPTVVKLPRAADHCTIRLLKECYKERYVDFGRVPSNASLVNAVPGVLLGTMGALIGAFSNPDDMDEGWKIGYALGHTPGQAIDEHTGGAYKLEPKKVFVVLTREPEPEQ